ncbi:MAG: restriction endonuclease subunit S [Phycisphaerales bacterium JB052]
MLSHLDLPDGWQAVPLRDLVTIAFSSVDKHVHEDEIPVCVCNYTHVLKRDLLDDRVELDAGSVSESELDRFRLRTTDIVVTKDSEDRFDIAKPIVVENLTKNDVVCGYHLAILRQRDNRYSPTLVAASLRLPAVRHELAVRCNGVTRFGLSLKDLGDTRIPVPPSQTQAAAIALNEIYLRYERCLDDQIAEKEKQFNHLLHTLMSGSCRLPKYAATPWVSCKLGGLFSNRRESGRSGLPTLSVTIHDGLVARESLGRRIGDGLDAEEHLLVQPDDIAYNMMRMWQGASGRAHSLGNVSPAYVVLEPLDGVDSLFASYWFKSPRMVYLFWAYSYGLTGDRLRLYFKDFAMIPVQVPPTLDEQKSIAAILEDANREIRWLRQLRSNVSTERLGMMQKLLTGEIRVPTDEPEPQEVSP